MPRAKRPSLPTPILAIEQHYTSEELAKLLCMHSNTLDILRIKGGGPKYIQFGKRHIVYAASDIQEFLNTCRRSSTSDKGDNQ